MADKEEKPKVMLEDIKLAKAWDDKACKDVPCWAGSTLKGTLGSKVEIVSSKPKKGYTLRSAFEPITFDN